MGKLKYGDAIQKNLGIQATGESLPKEMELEPVLPAAEFPENQRFTKLVWCRQEIGQLNNLGSRQSACHG